MLYAVGTYIDLRYLNDKAVVTQKPEAQRSKPAEYAVGTKILFLNFKSSLEVLSINKAQPA